MRTNVLTALFIATLVIAFTLTSPIATTFTPNADVALAQQAVQPQVAQDTPKEAVPTATVVTLTTIDPKSPIGEWLGDAALSITKTSRYFLTISKVTGEKVFGSVLLSPSVVSGEEEFEGTLIGNVLQFKTATKGARLVINGNSMTGEGRARNTYPITLKKVK